MLRLFDAVRLLWFFGNGEQICDVADLVAVFFILP
jgi:hypothetical protein